jgi:hypothetical protein
VRDLLNFSTETPLHDGPADSFHIALSDDFLNSLAGGKLPLKQPLPSRPLVIHVGSPAKYFKVCGVTTGALNSVIELASTEGRLVVLTSGVCVLPSEIIRGVHHESILRHLADGIKSKCRTSGSNLIWGHGGDNSKKRIFAQAYHKRMPRPTLSYPPPYLASNSTTNQLESIARYVSHLNSAQLACPTAVVKNYYDTGLLTCVLQREITAANTSMLLDSDALAMLSECSIGHCVSKFLQVTTKNSACSDRGVYNFFIGDGAARLNGLGERMITQIERSLGACSSPQANAAMATVFVMNNDQYAIGNNLIGEEEGGVKPEHKLCSSKFYDLLASHAQVRVCNDVKELEETLERLSADTKKYLSGASDGDNAPKLNLVVVRNINVTVPSLFSGTGSSMLDSNEMEFLRTALSAYSAGCKLPVPIYGNSAFEWIQYLDVFLRGTAEGKAYSYICGHSDIQAAQLAGFSQPEGKSVLLVNDVYGLHALGDAVRMTLREFSRSRRQLLILFWPPPSPDSVWDHFELHRQPTVWAAPGAMLVKFFVRSEDDAVFVDYDGSKECAEKVVDAFDKKVPVVVVTMLGKKV